MKLRPFALIIALMLFTPMAQAVDAPSPAIRAEAYTGNRDAQRAMAQYEEQREDYTSAINWYRKAAEQGDAIAQTKLAWFYYTGTGIDPDYEQAAHWYQQAAEQGNAEAQFNLALLYERGDGVDANSETALKWYRQATTQQHPPSITRLGWLYDTGTHVPANAQTAETWYRQAAQLGYAEAQFNLASLLDEQGRYTEAVAWYKKAAAQNHAMALYNLAALYQDGKGVRADEAEAHRLLEQAAKLGLDEAVEALK